MYKHPSTVIGLVYSIHRHWENNYSFCRSDLNFTLKNASMMVFLF